MYTVSIPDMQAMITHVGFDMREPLMFWGQPGAGKSEGVGQSAIEHDAFLCDIRLGQYDSIDLRGLPNIVEGSKLTTWNLPATVPFKGNDNFPDDRPILLFLDEINGCTNAVSGVAYQIINDRRAGEHELKDNVVIVAAGNREGDRGVTNRMPTPLANRFTHAEVLPDVESWCDWAIRVGLPPIGVAFMQFRKPLLSTFDPSKPDKAFATPRTWSKALRYFASPMPENIKQAAMAGAVGDGPAAEFWGFVDVWQKMTPIADIIKNPTTVPLPEEAAMNYAVTVAVSGAMDSKTVGPLHKYIMRLSPEFGVLAWQLAMKRDESLCATNEFLDIAKQYRAIFR